MAKSSRSEPADVVGNIFENMDAKNRERTTSEKSEKLFASKGFKSRWSYLSNSRKKPGFDISTNIVLSLNKISEISGIPRKLTDVDINLLFEQSTNDNKPKKQTPPSVKKGRQTEVESNETPSSSGSATAIPLASELFGDSDDSDWEGLDGTLHVQCFKWDALYFCSVEYISSVNKIVDVDLFNFRWKAKCTQSFWKRNSRNHKKGTT